MQQAWRYSQAELSLSGNVTIEKLFTENVTVLSTLGGSSPSSWLLKSGGKINGKVSAHNVIVEGNIDLGGSLNGVKLDEIVDATSPLSTISGVKNFSSITVSSFANVSSLNDVSNLHVRYIHIVTKCFLFNSEISLVGLILHWRRITENPAG